MNVAVNVGGTGFYDQVDVISSPKCNFFHQTVSFIFKLFSLFINLQFSKSVFEAMLNFCTANQTNFIQLLTNIICLNYAFTGVK
jgi:hypothetical protein